MTKSGKNSSSINKLKRKFAGKEGTVLEIVDDVQKVHPGQWRNPSEVEQLSRKYINKLGISVPEQRIKQFVSAYEEALKNGSSADDLIQKYGNNVDKDTLKAIKKYVPKSK